MKQFIKKNIDTFIAISIVSIFAISSVLILNARFEHLNKIKVLESVIHQPAQSTLLNKNI